MAMTPAINNPSVTGTIAALNQTITLPLNGNQANWIVQVDGTFVGTILCELTSGTRYDAVNFRRSAFGTVTNKITTTGTFRGNCAGGTGFRLTATVWTSGTANITIRASEAVGATFLNTFMEMRAIDQYYASLAGGRVAFNATSGDVARTTASPLIAFFLNPSGSGVDCYIDKLDMGSDTAGKFERFRNPATSAPMTAVIEVNRGGGANASIGKFYSQLGFTATGGTGGKINRVPVSTTYRDDIDGGIILLPGNSLYWTFTPASGTTAQCNIDLVWWEAIATT